MSNVKISELPSNTPIIGTELVPSVQADKTVKIPLRDIAAFGFKQSGVTITAVSTTLSFESDCQRIMYLGADAVAQKIVIPFTAPGEVNGLIFEGVYVGDAELTFEGVSGVTIVTPSGKSAKVTLKGGEFKLVRWTQNVWRLYGDLVGVSGAINVVNESEQSSRTLTFGDLSAWLRMSFTVANSVIVPKPADFAFSIGSMFEGVQVGTGQTSIVAATAGGGATPTINLPAGKAAKCRVKGSAWKLVKVDTNEWDLTGDLADA